MLRPNFVAIVMWILLRRWHYLWVDGNNKIKQKGVVFKMNTPFSLCISKINNTFINNAEDVDIVMTMYNLLVYSYNFLQYQEVCWIIVEMKWLMLIIILQMVDNLMLSIRQKITGKTEARPAQGGNDGDNDRPSQKPVPTLDVEVTIPLKHISNYWIFLDLPLVYCGQKAGYW